MSKDSENVSIATMNRGAIIERIDEELQRLADNVMDPNTDPRATRTITVKIAVKPNEHRDVGAVAVKVESKLAAPKAMTTTLFIGRDKGLTVLSENNSAQKDMFDDAPHKVEQKAGA